MSKSSRQPEIIIDGRIDSWEGVSARSVRDQLKDIGKVPRLIVRINSEGGDVFEGLAIFSMLQRQTAHVTTSIEGVAASMASVVAMAGDEVTMASNSFLMIHNPVNLAFGDAEDMRHNAAFLDKVTDQLARIYAARSKQPVEAILELMREETWFTAAEAVERGFADRITGELAIAASFDATHFQNVPEQLLARISESQQSFGGTERMSHHTPSPTTLEELQQNCPGMSSDFYVGQLQRHATIQQAQAAALAEKDRLLAEQAKGRRRSGVDRLPESGGSEREPYSGDPLADFNTAVAEKMKITGMDRRSAVASVARANPELHHAVVSATNPNSRRVQDLIAERFAG